MTEKNLESLIKQLTELKLTGWIEPLRRDLVQLTPQQHDIVLRLLSQCCAYDAAKKHDKAVETRIALAKFIKVQTVDDFDFNYNKSTKALQKKYLSLHHETAAGKFPRAVFVGTAGLGKTHLSRSLGYAACQAKNAVLFINAAKMVNQLAAAKASHTLEKELNRFRRPKVLIVDELGYVTMDNEASNLMFQVVSSRHDEDLGTIVTTNIPFGEWNQIFASNAIAHAVIDRLTDNASVFYVEGPSYREERSKKRS
jgi:DNA replication protein DnaC